MNTTWYKVSFYQTKIEPIQIVSESKNFITELVEYNDWFTKSKKTMTRRHNKLSTTESYFPSWELAHKHLEDRCMKRLEMAQYAIEEAKSDLNEVLKMTKQEAK